MRKIYISTFLPLGFIILFVILLVFGIRELRIINKHKEINEEAKELFKNQSLLNENLMILKTEKLILNNIVSINNFAEFEFLKTEHQSYEKQFKLNIKTLKTSSQSTNLIIKKLQLIVLYLIFTNNLPIN